MIILRDRPWRVSKTADAGDASQIIEVDALDGDTPSSLSVIVPPEELSSLPGEEIAFDPRGLDSLASWSAAHRILESTLIKETGLLSGARLGRVAIEAYQLAPALRLLAKPRPRLLIADDVGLGKTVEAGLVILELMARGRASRILVVTPSGLMDQWEEELFEKFGLSFRILSDAGGVSDAQTSLPAGVNPWDALPRVITSIDLIKKESVRNRALRKRWDLVIVDEAHALAVSGTPENPSRTHRTRLGTALREASRGLLLLTATPHNGYSHSYRSLIELVEPTLATFHGSAADLERRMETARIRRMKSQITRRASDGSLEKVFPKREVRGLPIEGLEEGEKELLRKVSSYCSRTAREAAGSGEEFLIGFAMQIVKKRALSSRAALRGTLEHRLAALRGEDAREEPPEQTEIRDLQADLPMGEAAADRVARRILRSAIPAEDRRRRSEIRALNAIRRLLRTLPESDPKVEALLSELKDTFREDPGEKTIVFTEYRDSLESIRVRLDADADFRGRYAVLQGGLSRRQRLKRQEEFESSKVLLLLATDAASEGLNLQRSCRRIIHFELPWNPNRLEQRNGRVDRYGQTRRPQIRWLFYPDSAEETVLDRLICKMENMALDRISVPDILGLLSGGSLGNGLLALDGEAGDVAGRMEDLVSTFEDRTADFIRGMQPLILAGNGDPSGEVKEAETWSRDDSALEDAVQNALGADGMRPLIGKDGMFRIEVPWGFQGPEVARIYPAATFRRTVAAAMKAEVVEYITPLHPLIRAMAEDARRRLLHVYPSTRGMPPRRLAARTVSDGFMPSVLFTFLASVRGGDGFLEERIVAVRIDVEGNPVGDPESSGRLLAENAPREEASRADLPGIFAGRFDVMRARAQAEADRFLAERTETLRIRREARAEALLRDLDTDLADRLREIDEEERRARGLLEDSGQIRLFEDDERRTGAFASRRRLVTADGEARREEIAEMRLVVAAQAPRPLGALFLVPGKEVP